MSKAQFLRAVLAVYLAVLASSCCDSHRRKKQAPAPPATGLVRIEVTPKSPSVIVGTAVSFTATGFGFFKDGTQKDLTATASWRSSDPEVAEIGDRESSKGKARTKTSGGCTITASQDGVDGSTNLIVLPANLLTIVVTPAEANALVGATVQFKATGKYENDIEVDLTEKVVWASAPAAVAEVSNSTGTKGLATALSLGQAEITATDPGTEKQGTAHLTVITDRVLERIEVTPVDNSLPLGRTLQYTATGVFSDQTTEDMTADVKWSSSAPGIASVDDSPGAKGMAHALAKGKTSVMALDLETSKEGRTDLTVTDAVLESIEVTPADQTLPKGRTLQYTATGKFSDGTSQVLTAQVDWTTAPAGFADISSTAPTKGLATARAPGDTEVSAADPQTKVKGSTGLHVTAAEVDRIEVTPSNPSLAKGKNLQFTATAVYTDQTTQVVTDQADWSVDPAGFADISNAASSKGLATALAPGQTVVTATDPVSTRKGTTRLQVTQVVLESIEVTPADGSLAVGRTLQYQAKGTFSDQTVQVITDQVTWSTDPTGFADVSNAAASKGLATGRAPRDRVDIIATDPETAVKGLARLKVTPATLDSIAVTPADQSLPKGRKLQYTATGTFSDGTTLVLTNQVAWSTDPTGFADISNAPGSKGLATAVAPRDQGLEVIATDPETSVKGSTTLRVTPVVLESIEVTPAGRSIAEGDTLQFQARGTFSDQSTMDLTEQVTWSSAPAGLASVSNAANSRGLATALSAGEVVITATDPPTSIRGSAPLTVLGAHPVFSRCDSNQDARHDIADGVWIIDELFRIHTGATCRQAMDCNNDHAIDLNDAIYCFNYFLKGGPRPADPYPGCGRDPAETLTCESFTACR